MVVSPLIRRRSFVRPLTKGYRISNQKMINNCEYIYKDFFINPQKNYLFYIGDLRSACLGEYLKKYLQKFYEKPLEMICIVQDVRKNYPKDVNIIVINTQSRIEGRKNNKITHIKMPGDHYFQDIAASRYIKQLIDDIQKRQDKIFAYIFNVDAKFPEFPLKDHLNIIPLCPDPIIINKYNNKLIQYDILKENGIPVPDGEICEKRKNIERIFSQKYYKNGAFVTAEFSMGGSHSCIIRDIKDLNKFDADNGKFLITRYMHATSCPSSLGIIANDKEIFILSIYDLCVKGTQWIGSDFPTKQPQESVTKIIKIAKNIGKIMATDGYRGFFNIDLLVTDHGDIYVTEINPRKSGTTNEVLYYYNHHFPQYPSPIELEFKAITENTFDYDFIKIENESSLFNSEKCYWGMRIVRSFSLSETEVFQDIETELNEKDLFSSYNILEKRINDPLVICDFVGKNVRVKNGVIARTIAVCSSPGARDKMIEKGLNIIQDSLVKC